jgi:hypothetical protein
VPTPIFGYPTDIGQICLMVKQRMLASPFNVVSDPSLVKTMCRSPIPHLAGKNDLILVPRPETQIQPRETGGAPWDIICVRRIDIYVRMSWATTEVSDDLAWLQVFGPYENAVINALNGRMLADQLGNDYVTCPINYLGKGQEDKGNYDEKARNLWGQSVHAFEFHYYPEVNPSINT